MTWQFLIDLGQNVAIILLSATVVRMSKVHPIRVELELVEHVEPDKPTLVVIPGGKDDPGAAA